MSETHTQETLDSTYSNKEASVPESVNFLDTLNEELRGHQSLKDFKDADSLAKSYLNLNSLLGKKFNDLSPEELQSYYTKLGRPEDAAGYRLPEGISEDTASWYKEMAFKIGLTEEQSANLLDMYTNKEREISELTESSKAAQAEEHIAALKKEFGQAFNKRVETAVRAVEEFGGSELQAVLEETGLGNHPAIVKAFAEIGKNLLEDKMTRTDAKASFGTSPEDARQEIKQLRSDPQFMKQYYSNHAIGHKEAVEKLTKLYQIQAGL